MTDITDISPKMPLVREIHATAAKLRHEAECQRNQHAAVKYRSLAWRLLNIADEADQLERDRGGQP
jgi:hypothetical protein